jgi:SpoVK/Ycf46/Vps4 family AAA+-type ATPase
LKKEQLTFSHIKDFINHALSKKDPMRKLSDLQTEILWAAWEKQSYTKLSVRTGYDDGTIKNAASPLYQELSEIFQKQISKHSFLKFIDEALEDRSSYIHKLEIEVHGSPPENPSFKGRTKDLSYLDDLGETRKAAFVFGPTGIGKTSLAGRFFTDKRRKGKYDLLIWYHPYSNDPENDVQNLLYDIFEDDKKSTLQDFLKFIKKANALIVIDGIDLWFENYQKTERYLTAFIESNHNCFLLFTCRNLPDYIEQLKILRRSVDTLYLEGLDYQDSLQILNEYNLQKNSQANRLIQAFQGNPLRLHEGCMRIQNTFGGKIDSFSDHITSFVGNFFDSEFERINAKLTELERIVLKAIAGEASEGKVSMDEIIEIAQNKLGLTISQLANAIDRLKKFSLVNLHSNLGKVEITVPKIIRKRYQSQIP